MGKRRSGRIRNVALLRATLALALGLGCGVALAEYERSFTLPASDDDLVGDNAVVTTSVEDTLVDIAARYHLGYNLIRSANPGVDAWLPGEGTEVLLPLHAILPDAPRSGIVVNVPEMRLYFYKTDPRGKQQDSVAVYPVSVGRGDWHTPLIQTRLTGRVKAPDWYPPQTIRAEHAARGDFLPAKVPAGPDNPLGEYLLVLDIPSYFIHGTNKKFGIGMQVTHGCIRMYPQDIEQLVKMAPKNTSVSIINQPIKTGWQNGQLFLEVHQPLEMEGERDGLERSAIIEALVAATRDAPETLIDWDRVDAVIAAANGVPEKVGQLPPAVSRVSD